MATLPPISEAGLQHPYRVYLLQVQQWMFVNLPPTEWGWKLEHDKLFPVPTTRDVVPESLLKLVMCNCKTTCKKKKNVNAEKAGLNVHLCVGSVLVLVAVTVHE